MANFFSEHLPLYGRSLANADDELPRFLLPRYCFIVLLYMTEKLEIILNGEGTKIPMEWTVTDLVEDLKLVGKQVAVELNGQIVSRDRWQEETLVSGDRIEVVHFVGGGAK